ncbi:hypothetical protein [Gordonia zhaorongruii]|uniref:sunset domain-containing protein n=1 Tax=Gordonia zhaorongruii TaxID=2597659 RepID=UPI0014056099|nr:hypothetical protein [Gordonia zhaorongruii]
MKKRLRGLTLGLAVGMGATLLLAPHAQADTKADASKAIEKLSDNIQDGDADRGFNDSGLGKKRGSITANQDGFEQKFRGGTIYWSKESGAHVLYGAINEKYDDLDGTKGDVGVPKSDEADVKLKTKGRAAEFTGAGDPKILWTPKNDAWLVRGPFSLASDKLGADLGAPKGEIKADGGAVSQEFEGGTLDYDVNSGEWTSRPASLAKDLDGVKVPADWENAGLPGVNIPGLDAAQNSAANATDAPRAGAEASSDDGISPWWWLLLLLLIPVLLGIWALLKGKKGKKADSGKNDQNGKGGSGFDPKKTAAGVAGGATAAGAAGVAAAKKGGQGAADTASGAAGGAGAAAGGLKDKVTGHGDQPGGQTGDRAGNGAPDETRAAAGESGNQGPGNQGAGNQGAGFAAGAAGLAGGAAAGAGAAAMGRQGQDNQGQDQQGQPGAQPTDGAPQQSGAQQPGAQQPVADTSAGKHSGDGVGQFDRGGQGVPVPIGGHLPLQDPLTAPEGYPIKGDSEAGKFYVPGQQGYDAVKPAVWFASESVASAAGFTPAGR